MKERILALAVEKTGYPKDMLDLDLDLEADLGVDTVKQAEMFAAIREIYNIPRDENRKLRDYPTLAHVIRFVYEKRPDLAGTCSTSAPPSTGEPSRPRQLRSQLKLPTDDSIKEKVLEIVAEKTGYPKDMLDLDLDLEADLGVDTVKQAEMFAASGRRTTFRAIENLKLRDFPTLAHVIKFAHDRAVWQRPTPGEQEPTDQAAKSCSSPVAATPAKSRTPGARQFRRRESHSAPRAGADPAPAARHSASQRASRSDRGRRVVIMPDKGGVAEALAQAAASQGRRSPSHRRRA